MRQGRLERIAWSAWRQSSSGSSVCLRKAAIRASSSGDSTVERRVFGPIGASSTQSRFRHFITVSG